MIYYVILLGIACIFGAAYFAYNAGFNDGRAEVNTMFVAMIEVGVIEIDDNLLKAAGMSVTKLEVENDVQRFN